MHQHKQGKFIPRQYALGKPCMLMTASAFAPPMRQHALFLLLHLLEVDWYYVFFIAFYTTAPC